MNDQQRKQDQAFYKGKTWRRLRETYLADNPICECGQPATEVHHIKSRKQYPELSYTLDNLQAQCKPCHSKKTWAEVNEQAKATGHVVCFGDAAYFLDNYTKPNEIIFEPIRIGKAMGCNATSPDVATLLLSLRHDLIRRIKAQQISRRCFIVVDDEAQARPIAEGIKGLLIYANGEDIQTIY